MSADQLEILIVDDTPMNLVLLEHLLKRDNCLVRKAQGGQEAVDLVRDNDFALVILDIQMPGMDGYDTARAIKALERGRQLPIIFITSIFQDEDSVKLGYEAGGVDYLFRPVDPQTLRAKVGVFLEINRQKVLLEEEVRQRSRAVHAQTRAEEKYRELFQRAVEGIFQSTLDGDFLDANPALAHLFGYDSPEEMIGKPGLAKALFADPEDRERYLETLRENGLVNSYEIRAVTRTGQEIWLSESSCLVAEAGREPFLEGVIEDISERKDEEMDLERQAHYDALTGVPNRHLFFDRLEHHLESAKRYDTRIGVLFIDLKGFKRVNDLKGHAAGDKLLREVADKLGKRVRSSDTLARLGGDEFGVLLTWVDSPQGAEKAAQDLLDGLAGVFTYDGVDFDLSATVGISLYPEDGKEADTLVRRADKAMYMARRMGDVPIGFSLHSD